MSQGIDDRQRQVIPRWRPFRVAAALGMIDAARPRKLSRRTAEMLSTDLEQARIEFVRHKSPVFAAGLVDAALVANRLDVAQEAARLLLAEDANNHRQRLARVVLGSGGDSRLADPPALKRQERFRRVADHRRLLRLVPVDPIRWVDLAREYTILGEDLAAGKAIRIAVALAPHDRFVLRAASRYHLHRHDPEAARRLLLRSPRTREDPWLMAAEIVAASRTGATSNLVKLGSKMVEGGPFLPRHITELASALGTLEHESGNRKHVRRLFTAALVDPTENTVAQAEWIGRHMSAFDVPKEKLCVPRAFEAKAWEAIAVSDFEQASAQALEWYRDEPFANRSALFAGWVLALGLGDFRSAIALAEDLRERDMHDPSITLELLFFKCYVNRLDEAEALLGELAALLIEARRNGTEPVWADAWPVYRLANLGLIAFRRGHIEQGRGYYIEAIAKARELENNGAAAGALVYYAREEARVDPVGARPIVDLARESLIHFVPAVRPLYESVLARSPDWLPSGAHPLPIAVHQFGGLRLAR